VDIAVVIKPPEAASGIQAICDKAWSGRGSWGAAVSADEPDDRGRADTGSVARAVSETSRPTIAAKPERKPESMANPEGVREYGIGLRGKGKRHDRTT
jgi:hypothetical protein